MRRGYIDWVHGQLHYRRTGEGEAILLLGGAPRSGSQFETMMLALAERGFCAIAPDMPGFGQSDRVPEGTAMAGIAAAMPALMDALDIGQAHLFGLHSGGKVAAAAAAGADRFASLIIAGKSHSIGADRQHRNATVKQAVEQRYFANGADRVDGAEALRGWAAEQRTLASLWWDDAIFTADDPVAVMRAIEQRLIDHIGARRTVRDFYAANFGADFTGDLARAAAPLLVIEITCPAEDASIGRQAAALTVGIAGAQMLDLPQTDGPGLFFHTGIAPLAAAIADFAAAHPARADARA